MNNKPQIPQSRALALECFAFITKIQDLLRQGFPLSVALEQVSFHPLSLPDCSQRLRARRTIEDWWYDYQKGGFADLTPKVRTDKSQPRTLTPEQQKWILEQAQAHLAVPVKVLYRRWRETGSQLPALNSIYRFLREHELHTKARRQLMACGPIPKPSTKRSRKRCAAVGINRPAIEPAALNLLTSAIKHLNFMNVTSTKPSWSWSCP